MTHVCPLVSERLMLSQLTTALLAYCVNFKHTALEAFINCISHINCIFLFFFHIN